MSLAPSPSPAWLTKRKPRFVAPSVIVVSPWSERELATLRPFAKLARIPRGAVVELAVEMERSYGAVRQRLVLLRRAMKKPDGAEGGLLQGKVQPDRVPRGAPSAAAPGSGQDVSSLDLAAAVEARVAPCTVSPAPGAAVSGAAPGVVSRKEKLSRSERERRRRQKLLDEKRAAKPAPDNIARRCSCCGEPFVAISRFLFRCEPCRESVVASGISAQFEASGVSRRVGAPAR